MRALKIDRRDLLRAGAAAAAVSLAPAAASAAEARAGGVMVFDAASDQARAVALKARAPGQRLVALEGDPMRLWRDSLAEAGGPISGVTRWSDFVVLRELAHDRRLRVTREERHPVQAGPLLVAWTFS